MKFILYACYLIAWIAGGVLLESAGFTSPPFFAVYGAFGAICLSALS